MPKSLIIIITISLCICFVTMLFPMDVGATLYNSNTDWFKNSKYGLITHFLYGWNDITGDWNTLVNGFNVPQYANQCEQAGAGYVYLTLGQGAGLYCSPNTKYDNLLAAAGLPGRSPNRDLPSDVYNALNPKGIKLMLYFVADPSWGDEASRKALTQSGSTAINDTMRQNVIDMAREWSLRYGNKISGWWIDGFGSAGYSSSQKQAFADALKAGNQNAIIAFGNNDLQITKMGDYEDYTAGEQNNIGPMPASRWLNGIQWHVMTFLGNFWGESGLKNTTIDVASWIRDVSVLEGACTFDVQQFKDGSWNSDQFNQLKEIKAYIRDGQAYPYINVNNNNSGITYNGTWSYGSNRGGNYFSDANYTSVNGNYFEYTFNGTGIEYITEKANDMGEVDIYIDGVFQQTVNCYSSTKQTRQTLFSKTNLTAGTHTIKAMKKNGTYMILDVLKVSAISQGSAATYNDTASGITYSGSWGYLPGRSGNDYQNDVHYTGTNNDYFEYTFAGTGIDYVTERANDMGNVDVYIDGVFQQTVNCYNASTQYQQTVFSKTGLSPGTHVIKGVKNSGSYMLVDALRVYGGGPSSTTMNDNASGIGYIGNWGYLSGRSGSDYQNDVHYTSANNDYFEYAFNGTGIEYITEKANDMGEVDIYIDGVFQQNINCYNSGTLYQQAVYSKTGLSAGNHTIKGVKKSGGYMLVDAFKIYN